MSRRGRRRAKQTLQITWIVAAIALSVILLIGYEIGFGKKESDSSTVVNAADNNNTEDRKETIDEQEITPVITPEATPTPAPTVTVTPTPEPTPEATPTPEPTQEATEQKLVALTFDDGPYPPVTSRILALLEQYDSHATFFVMGDRMDTYPDMVKEVFEAGNQIGNHTLSHKQLTKLTVSQIKHEVEYSNELINKNAEVGDAYLRPPYGAKNDTVKSTVKVPMILWSVDSLDWSSKNKDAIYKEIMDHVQDGDIILMHDLYSTTADAMELVIPELIKQGYQLVTVEELLRLKGITAEAGVVYHNGR